MQNIRNSFGFVVPTSTVGTSGGTIASGVGKIAGRVAGGVNEFARAAVTTYKVGSNPAARMFHKLSVFSEETERLMKVELRRAPTEREVFQRMLDTCEYVLGVNPQDLLNAYEQGQKQLK